MDVRTAQRCWRTAGRPVVPTIARDKPRRVRRGRRSNRFGHKSNPSSRTRCDPVVSRVRPHRIRGPTRTARRTSNMSPSSRKAIVGCRLHEDEATHLPHPDGRPAGLCTHDMWVHCAESAICSPLDWMTSLHTSGRLFVFLTLIHRWRLCPLSAAASNLSDDAGRRLHAKRSPADRTACQALLLEAALQEWLPLRGKLGARCASGAIPESIAVTHCGRSNELFSQPGDVWAQQPHLTGVIRTPQ
jgi:hypothetical protein